MCDHPWGGSDCSVFRFQPAPVAAAYGLSPKVTAWGGLPVLLDNTYHLLVTEIVNHCGLTAWGSNSRVIHATSNNLLGPYTYQNEAIPVWSHNPHIIVDRSSGTPVYLLFHIGSGDATSGIKNCAGNAANTSESAPSTMAPLASGVLHTASNPAGPWTPQNPPGLGGCNNPAPYVYPNGSILLFCWQGGNMIYTTDSWKGPWTGRQIVWSGDAGVGTWEDPFIWRDKKGVFKLIAHVYTTNSAHYWDRISGFGYSYDGIHWTRKPFQPYTNYIQSVNGTNVFYTTRERPKIFFDKDGTTPLALFTGVASGTNCFDCKLQSGTDYTWNVAQAFVAP